MKSIVWTKYGAPDVLQLRDVEKPTPKDNQVLIKIHAATVTAGDCEVRSMTVPVLYRLPLWLYIGFRKPTRITNLGQELAGEIEAVGKDVTLFKPGDQVFATVGLHLGAYAEYICLPEKQEMGVLALKPANMTYDEAASVPTGALEALHFLRKANVKPGEKVLVYGAGGTIGTFAVQLAKIFGAEVTAVDKGTKLEMLRGIGADHVIDYSKEDFTRNKNTYDAIFDIPGKSPFFKSINTLRPNGRYLLANPGLLQMLLGPWLSSRHKQIVIGTGSQKAEDLIYIKGLIEAGKIKSIIDRRFPLEQTAEAHRYAETGQKKGNIIITVSETRKTL